MNASGFPLFSRFGVELEYMMVDARTLTVRPLADQLIRLETGRVQSDVTRGSLEWSNELALHVIELKTGRPATQLYGLAQRFQDEVRHVNTRLAELGARLLPTAMHPWMRPDRESRLWPHDNHEIYATFDRIFGCHGHGWTNLQSVHLNLPFASDNDFLRLHTAIRLVLPLLPALAASSPFVEGRRAPHLDMRLEVYRGNCARIPSVTAGVVPESIASPAAYRRRILERIRRDLQTLDPEAVLDPEWTNARGAIARFCRNTIEIRVLDIQECPAADLAILAFTVAILRTLVTQSRSSLTTQLRVPTRHLRATFRRASRVGRSALIGSAPMARAFGLKPVQRLTVGGVLELLLSEVAAPDDWWRPVIAKVLAAGSLAERILRQAGQQPSRQRLRRIYGDLADSLENGVLYET